MLVRASMCSRELLTMCLAQSCWRAALAALASLQHTANLPLVDHTPHNPLHHICWVIYNPNVYP